MDGGDGAAVFFGGQFGRLCSEVKNGGVGGLEMMSSRRSFFTSFYSLHCLIFCGGGWSIGWVWLFRLKKKILVCPRKATDSAVCAWASCC